MIKRIKKETVIEDNRCCDCAYSRDHYNANYKGEFIMGKCNYKSFSHLLAEKACTFFKRKTHT